MEVVLTCVGRHEYLLGECACVCIHHLKKTRLKSSLTCSNLTIFINGSLHELCLWIKTCCHLVDLS